MDNEAHAGGVERRAPSWARASISGHQAPRRAMDDWVRISQALCPA